MLYINQLTVNVSVLSWPWRSMLLTGYPKNDVTVLKHSPRVMTGSHGVHIQYRYLIPAPVDRTSGSAWLYKHLV